MAHSLALSPPTTRLAEGTRVQLVEADEAQLEMHRRALERAGATVLGSTSAGAVVRAASELDFDVLVCDTRMGRVDGFTLLRAVRHLRPDLGRFGAIALADRRDEEEITRALRAGFHLHAVKPLAPPDLVQMVAALGKRTSLPAGHEVIRVAV